MPGKIRIGIGGWTYPDWRDGAFYPKGLPQKQELSYAARALTSIEINATFYSTFKATSWRGWRDQTPDGFVFSVKASRFCTNRKTLTDAGPSIERFLGQGLVELGDKLGPINWQLTESKKFDAAEIGAFLALLPAAHEGLRLRHALEVRHPSFEDPAFYALCRERGVAVVYAGQRDEKEEPGWPTIDQPTADFSYARFMTTQDEEARGVDATQLAAHAKAARAWAERGDVFLYFISAAKHRNPVAAQALQGELGIVGAK